MEKKYYSRYKGIWYKYTPLNLSQITGVWELSESIDGMTGVCANFNADIYRIDQCFDKFFKLIKMYKDGLG